MEQNIMNEEVMEVATEEIVTTKSGSVVKKFARVGLVVLAGMGIYKYVFKPLAAKRKAKKGEKKAVDAEVEELMIFDNDGNAIEK